MQKPLPAVCLATILGACAAASPLPPEASFGPTPQLQPPHVEGPIPTIKVAKAIGWPQGQAPLAPDGFTVTAFADGLDHPRWLLMLSNGDVLVAEASSEPHPAQGIKDWFMQRFMKHAGSLQESPNKVLLLRDANRDGVAETKTILIDHDLNQPFGMALIGDQLYVGNTDSVMRFPFHVGDTAITAPGTKIASLPAGEHNRHWARNLLASEDGKTLYVTVGSGSNIAEFGLANEERRAAILTFNPDGSGESVFASGLRNPNGLAFEPTTHKLWTVVNERDELGDDIVPDYLTSVRQGGFYGWPDSYWGQNVDPRMKDQQRPDLVARAIVPDYAVGAHTATLGLAFYTADAFPAHYRGGAFLGQHGSWNRSVPIGYEVAFVPFANGKPAGSTEHFLTGFLNDKGEAMGRPVGVIVDQAGALLIADDVGDAIWRVSARK